MIEISGLTGEKLFWRFEEYAKSAQECLAGITSSADTAKRLTLVERGHLIEAVEWLESRPIFQELVEATRDAFGGSGHHSFFGWWTSSIKHFFRRSGFYLDCYEGHAPENTVLFSAYEQAFRADEIEVTYLLPLEWVRFVEPQGDVQCSREKPVECRDFAIRHYSPNDLESLSGNRINRVFYPSAVWDTEKLAWYWYITIKTKQPVFGIGKIPLDFSELTRIQRKLVPNWLSPFEAQLYRLVLYNWLPEYFRDYRQLLEPWPEELETFSWSALGICYSPERFIRNQRYQNSVKWQGFRIPFRLECNNHFIQSPPVAPNTSLLELEPCEGPGGVEEEVPADWLRFELDPEATEELEQLVREELSVIDTALLNSEAWSFYRIALNYLLKAFLTDPYEAPAEQILWHITALESLLGRREDEGELVKKIAQRLGRLLGKNANERDRIEHNFRKLYKFRCDLVHGDKWKESDALYLYLARNFARQACLQYAEVARNCIKNGRPLPARDEIITALDENSFDKLFGRGSYID